METPLVNSLYLLEKYPGKGGWTYASIPEITPDKKAPFGWVKVKGQIDHIQIKNYRLMPMGNGRLFLPVKASIRKQIGKKEGDWIHVILYHDNTPTEIPEELLQCFKDDPIAHQAFLDHADAKQKDLIEHIYASKTDEIKVERIAAILTKLANGQQL